MQFGAKLGVALGAAALCLSGLSASSAAAAELGAQAYVCNVTDTGNAPGDKYYAGYYSGNTVQPSSSSVSAAGKEAQCLLEYKGYDVGIVDGIFGSKSQAAAKKFQTRVNELCGRKVLDVDGLVGPKTWPYLRDVYVCWTG
ncbi:peptidoglycan-binding domain-containing protein [Streptomyces sp. SudanB52_2052]|uniref:peptidoglycan-binding domain-containing protein n=1 Tax=Streptomyces sp. SudanB52_2052 TaxID=3035276 RepID=UPI003F55E0D4